jgi:DNA polymerase III gamma/tau subunit
MGLKLSNPIKSYKGVVEGIIKKPGDLKNWGNLGLTMGTGGWATSDMYDQQKREEQAKKEQEQNAAAREAGVEKGSELWSKWTGVTPEENAQAAREARDVATQRLRQTGQDPVTAAIMANKAGAVASAQRNLASQGVKGAIAQNAISNIERQKQADVNASLYGQQAQALDTYRDMISSNLQGRLQTSYTQAALDQRMPQGPKQTSWIEELLPV